VPSFAVKKFFFDGRSTNAETGIKLFFVKFHMYTLNHKKRDILFLTITLANLRRFL